MNDRTKNCINKGNDALAATLYARVHVLRTDQMSHNETRENKTQIYAVYNIHNAIDVRIVYKRYLSPRVARLVNHHKQLTKIVLRTVLSPSR